MKSIFSGAMVETVSIDEKINVGVDEFIAIFAHGKYQTIYRSSDKFYCLAEQVIDSGLLSEDRWVVIHQLKSDSNKYYAAAVKKDLVSAQVTGSLEEVKSHLHYELESKSYTVYSNVPNVSIPGVSVKVLKSLNDFKDEEVFYTSLKLSNEKKFKRKTVLAVGIIVFFTFLIWLFYPKEPEVIKEAPKADPYQAYKQDIRNQLEAPYILDMAMTLYAYSLTFPDGVSFNSLKLEGKYLVVDFDNSDVTKSIWTSWLNENSQFTSYQGDGVLKVPVQTTNSEWIHKQKNIKGYGDYLNDVLLSFEPTLLDIGSIVNIDGYSQQTLKVEYSDEELGLLNILRSTLKQSNSPVFVTSLELRPSKNEGHYGIVSSMRIELVIKGIAK